MDTLIDLFLSLFSLKGFFIMLTLLAISKAINFVPEGSAYIVYTMGKYTHTLSSGLGFTIPFIQYIERVVSLKEQTFDVSPQIATTSDNTEVTVNGVVYLKVVDPVMAVNDVENYILAATTLAQTTMRSVIGTTELDKCFQDKDAINARIQESMSSACASWGCLVTRYELMEVNPNKEVKESMARQMESERTRRAAVIEAEGIKAAAILKAEGSKQAMILEAEAKKEAAQLEADALTIMGEAMASPAGKSAVQFRITEQAIAAYGNIAKKGSIVLTDGNAGQNISNLIAQATAVTNGLKVAGNE